MAKRRSNFHGIGIPPIWAPFRACCRRPSGPKRARKIRTYFALFSRGRGTSTYRVSASQNLRSSRTALNATPFSPQTRRRRRRQANTLAVLQAERGAARLPPASPSGPLRPRMRGAKASPTPEPPRLVWNNEFGGTTQEE